MSSIFEETDWLILSGGHVTKFRRVPAFAFSDLRRTINIKVESEKPKPPLVVKGTQQYENLQDPDYLEAMRVWELKKANADNDGMELGALKAGLILKNGVPADDGWVVELIEMFKSLGMGNPFENNPYQISYNVLAEIYYKKYVVLASPKDCSLFTDFMYNGKQITAESAVKFFRPETTEQTVN